MHVNRLTLVFAVSFLLLVSWLLAPVAQEQAILAPQGSQNRYMFGGTKTIGQLFTPPVGLASVTIPLGTDRVPNGPLILHIRASYFGEDIRTSTVFSLHDEGQNLVFSFTPIVRPSETMMWVLEAPHSPLNSVWVFRELDATAYPEGQAFTNNKKLAGNFGFTLTDYDIQAETLFQQLMTAKPWEKYSLVFGFAGAILVVFILRLKPSLFTQFHGYWVAAIAVLSVIAHSFFISNMPVINDEGAYAQDALQTTFSFWPLHHFLTKGPLYIFALKLWFLLTPHTILFWRLFSVLCWGATVLLATVFAKSLGFRRQGQMITALAVGLTPLSLVLSTPLLLQVASTATVMLGLWFLSRARHSDDTNLVILGAVVMVAAYFIRASSLIALVMGVVFLFLFSERKIFRKMMVYCGVCAAIFIGVFLLLTALIGYKQTMVVFNFEAYLIAQQRTQMATQSEPYIRQLTQQAALVWQAAPPLIMGLFLAPIVALRRRSLLLYAFLGIALISLFTQVSFNLIDMNYLLPGTFPVMRFTILLLVFMIPLLWFTIQILYVYNTTLPIPRTSLKAFFFVALWLVLLTVLYDHWGRFRESYWVEFIVPLSLLLAWAFEDIGKVWNRIAPSWQRPLAHIVLYGLIGASTIQGIFLLREHPPTGNMSADSLYAIAQIIQKEVPEGEELFTAQPTVTAVAQRPIVLGYSHPGWYREERFGTVSPELRALFFIEPAELTEYFKTSVQYVLFERRTAEVYFDGYPDRQKILKNDFVEIARVENEALGEPFIIYKRR